MGRSLADAFPESREVFERADEALGTGLSQVCFEGGEEELALTETTQPAILTVSVAALRALESRGVTCESAAGHSLGEYSAHVAAGTIAFEDAVRAVRSRGRFMQEAVPVGEGAMAAIIGLDADRVESICREAARGRVLSPANLNGPGQVVIAGHADAVQRAVEAASAAGAKRAIPLTVSAPFHCALMEPAARRLVPVLEETAFADPSVPVFVNVDAAAVTSGGAAREALIRQVASPVRWQDLVTAMAASGIDTIVEIGPGRVLSGLARRIDRSLTTLAVSDPEGVEKVAAALGGRS
jgi:[acyl-carrier-protein] S-malonyltransferase